MMMRRGGGGDLLAQFQVRDFTTWPGRENSPSRSDYETSSHSSEDAEDKEWRLLACTYLV